MNVGAVMEFVTVIAFVVILMGGKQKREGGWRILSFLLVIVAVLQCAGMAIVVSLPIYRSLERKGRVNANKFTNRPTSTTMIQTASSSAGPSINHSTSVLSLGV